MTQKPTRRRFLRSFSWGAAASAAALAGLLPPGRAAAQQMSFFRIATGSAAGTYFPIGGLLANEIGRAHV